MYENFPRSLGNFETSLIRSKLDSHPLTDLRHLPCPRPGISRRSEDTEKANLIAVKQELGKLIALRVKIRSWCPRDVSL